MLSHFRSVKEQDAIIGGTEELYGTRRHRRICIALSAKRFS